jgi:hypothetical protein
LVPFLTQTSFGFQKFISISSETSFENEDKNILKSAATVLVQLYFGHIPQTVNPNGLKFSNKVNTIIVHLLKKSQTNHSQKSSENPKMDVVDDDSFRKNRASF